MKAKMYQPQSIVLPKEIPIHRTFPFKSPNQIDWFDDIIFYDVFYKHDNSSIICIGPPLLNLEGVLELQEILCNGKQLRYSYAKFLRDHSLIVIKVPRSLRNELTVQLSFRFNLFETVVEISRNHPPVREDRNSFLTLVAIQKDNPLEWIKDWMHWHNRMHGVRQLVLYDNGSRKYGHDELVDTLHGEEGDLQNVLVNWDFPWTWDGWNRKALWDPWPQIAAMNHCYFKYGDCGWLLSLDIDEYLVAEDATSLRDYIRQTPGYHLPFKPRQVWGIGPEKPLAERSFRDFVWRSRAWVSPTGKRFWKCACQCNRHLLMGVHGAATHSIFYEGFGRFRFRSIQAKLGSLMKRIRQLFNRVIHNHNSPRERFWIYHFDLLSTGWKPNREDRVLYRDKAYFEAQGVEIIYDDTMIKQAKEHGL